MHRGSSTGAPTGKANGNYHRRLHNQICVSVATKTVGGAVANRAFDGAWRLEASPLPAPEKGFPWDRKLGETASAAAFTRHGGHSGENGR